MGEDGRKSECGEELIMMILDTVVGRLQFRRFIDTYMLLCVPYQWSIMERRDANSITEVYQSKTTK